jgi:hypothetical protein
MTASAPDLAILVEWAIFSREDWDADRVEGAVLAAKGAQWPDARIGLFLVRMVWDTAATPWDLSNAARQPQGTASTVPASPEARARYAAEARSAMAARRRPAA